MAQENNIAQQLNDLLVTRGYDPELRDAEGNDGCEPKDAKLFKIDYTAASGKNYGTMVIILDVGNDLKAMFGNNLGRGMEDADKNEWFEFQHQLSQFANKHRWTYTGDDISKLKYTMQGLAAIKEGLFEGYYGTRRISYAGEPTEARLMIRHNRNLGENDARFRYVESIFVETADGERYRLPFTNLAGGRAMLEHVRQGGKPYDVRGNHICEMITELKVLARFNRASQGRVVEGIKQGVVEGAQTYYKSLRESIKRLASPRGYAAYFESWHPADITAQDQLVEDIKTLFIEQTIDDRIEQALPLLAKIQRGREMKEADIFENWVNTLAEGTWCLPETPEQLNRLKELMSSELIVGPDGTNATEQLHDLVGDDLLFDRISELAAQDARANLWDDSEVQARLQELGVQMPNRAEPDMAAQPEQPPEPPVAEADNISTFESLQRMRHLSGMPLEENVLNDNGSTLGHIIQTYQRDVRDFMQNNGDMSEHLYDALYDYYFDDMPYGVKKARTGDPYEWISQRFYDDLQGSHMVDENLGGIVGEAPAPDGRTPSGKPWFPTDSINNGLPKPVRAMGHMGLDKEYHGIGQSDPEGFRVKDSSGRASTPTGIQLRKVPSPNMVTIQGVPSANITAHPLDYEPLQHTELKPSPVAGLEIINPSPVKGIDLTQGDNEQELEECNYTPLNEYCPCHGLKECWLEEMNLSILATGSRLIEDLDEDMTDVGDVVGQAARSVTNRLGQAASDMYEPIGNFVKGVKQGWHGTAQTTPRPTAAVAMPVRSPDIIAYDLPAPDTSVIDPDLDEADMMNPEIPSDFGSDSHLRDLLKLSGAYQAGDRSALKKSNDAMLARMTRSDPPTATPSFSAPGAAHDGQGGHDYSDEDPDQSDAETARLARFSVSDEPKGQAHAGQGGYDYSDEEPDQSDAETARLGRSGEVREDGKDPMDARHAVTDSYYESREGDALLARIKSLALLR